MDRAGLVGEDGETHMGLYDIAYMLAVPGMTVTAPKDGTEMLGLLRSGLAHDDGPFCAALSARRGARHVPPAAEIEPVPYARGRCFVEAAARAGMRRGVAILAVGTMVLPALAAAEMLGRRRDST